MMSGYSQKQEDDKNKKIVTAARKRLSIAIEAWSNTRNSELDDLRFYAGSPDNQWQWPQDVVNSRTSAQGSTINARPCLTINKLPQHVKQITNDQRQNRPGIKVIPANDEADSEVAEVFNGIIRHIEYESDADVAYDTACENQVTYGEGYIRLITEYKDEKSFDQRIKILRVRNSFSVYLDPNCQDPAGADAKWCIITQVLSKEEYEQLYPNACSISTIQSLGVGDNELSQWVNQETIRIAEYFYVDTISKKLNLYPNNVTAFDNTPPDRELKKQYGDPIRSRTAEFNQIKWVKTNGYDILEESDWPGKWIPIVRVIGNEFEVDGEIYLSGLVRNAKDAQRMYNYWVSQEAEMLALAPKAPFIGYSGQFEGFETEWKTANVNNWPYLEVNSEALDGQGNVLPLPARAQPPMASSGLLQAKAGASEDIKNATGQYNAALGMTSNERSGKAILARQREADTGTYHYVDNLARAVRYIGRQLVDLIPKVMDIETIALILGEDGETDTVKLNPMQQEGIKKIKDENGTLIEKIFNLNVGKFDVKVITGPGYATKRQEALESMAQLLQGNPQLWAAAGDLFVKNMDWPGAQELAKRLAKTIDPKLLSDDNDPVMAAAKQQMEQMAQQMEQMHQMLMNVQNSMEAKEIEIDAFKAQVDAYNAETNRIKATLEGWSPEQIQDIVRGTIDAAIQTGDLIGNMPSTDSLPENEPPPQGENFM